MQTKEILDQWSKDKDKLFFYKRSSHDTGTPCIVTGFTSKDIINRYGRKTGTEKLVEVLMLPAYYDGQWDEESIAYPVRPDGKARAVKTRYIFESLHGTWESYIQGNYEGHRKQEVRQAEADTLRNELAEALKAVGITDMWVQGPRKVTMYSDEATRKLIATLRDAHSYYMSLTTEEEVA